MFSTFDGSIVAADDVQGAFGVAYQASQSLRLGGGMRVGRVEGDLPGFSGETDSSYFGLQAFIGYEGASGLRVYASAVADTAEHEVIRGYLSGVTPAFSAGERDGTTYGGSVLLGWEFAAADAMRLMPFLRYDVTQIILDTYTETTGPFPARFDEIEDTVDVSRLGVEATVLARRDLRFWASAAWAHRFDDQLPSIRGEILALASSFVLPGGAVDDDWAEARVGLGWDVSEAVTLRSSMTGTTDGDTAPTFSGALGVDVRL